MNKFLLFQLIACLFAMQLSAQVTSVTIETHYTDNGTVAGYPQGHATYRIYANLTHETDRLTSVYGSEESPLFLRVSGSGIWNNPNGGKTATNNSCSDHLSNPALEYDSYLTLGYACNDGSSNAIYALDDPNVPTWMDEAFDASPFGINNVAVNTVVGALWFGTPNNSNTEAGTELRILIAQITTNGEICGTFNFQVFPEYAGAGSEYIEQTGFSFGSLQNSDILINTEVASPACFGFADASIEVIASGGTGLLTYSFDNISFGDNAVLDSLVAGTYTIFVKDETGCTAIETIEIVNPPSIFATPIVSAITCHDSEDGAILINNLGGTGNLTFSIDGDNYSPAPNFDSLSPGTYNIHVKDNNGCSFDPPADIVLINPELIETTVEAQFVSCNGLNDGEILVTVTGGVGPYEFNVGEGFVSGNPISGLSAGNYDVLVRDVLGCISVVQEQLLIAEPTAIEVQGLQVINITDVTPGGNTDYTVSGGVSPYTYEWTNSNGIVVSTSENMPQLNGQSEAGDYTLKITDGSGCNYMITLNVGYSVNIHDEISSYSINVFPNPTSGLLTLKFNLKETKNVGYQINDAVGKQVVSADLGRISNEYIHEIDLKELSGGIYFLRIIANNSPRTIQLVKY